MVIKHTLTQIFWIQQKREITNMEVLQEKILCTSSYKWLELFTLFLIFPLLIIFDIIELKYRWFLFLFIFIYVGLMIKIIRPSYYDLGIKHIRISALLKGLLAYILIVLTLILFLYLRKIISIQSSVFYLGVLIIYPLLSAPAQELFFRSFFFFRYNELTNQYILATLNILFFAFYHRIYGGWLSVLLSLVGGIVLTSLYLKYKNFWWVCICHGILGIVVFISGLGKHFTDLIH